MVEKGNGDTLMAQKNVTNGKAKSAGANYPYLVTWYDEDYNRKERTEDQKLPPLRRWDFQSIAWLPERSDHPISRKLTYYFVIVVLFYFELCSRSSN